MDDPPTRGCPVDLPPGAAEVDATVSARFLRAASEATPALSSPGPAGEKPRTASGRHVALALEGEGRGWGDGHDTDACSHPLASSISMSSISLSSSPDALGETRMPSAYSRTVSRKLCRLQLLPVPVALPPEGGRRAGCSCSPALPLCSPSSLATASRAAAAPRPRRRALAGATPRAPRSRPARALLPPRGARGSAVVAVVLAAAVLQAAVRVFQHVGARGLLHPGCSRVLEACHPAQLLLQPHGREHIRAPGALHREPQAVLPALLDGAPNEQVQARASAHRVLHLRQRPDLFLTLTAHQEVSPPEVHHQRHVSLLGGPLAEILSTLE
eukprot:CAMPEP_0181349544 /NCGR_PEP_ID=MMETSP1106-20121128/784_1 /TAXON_ID=81844 /ORGANISM="Mantoniella antarctica, Strain SL-175" /LENGTH=328 /DNA_ID=CAMNT_0023461947 /DNA_START=292 /DNA_END=1279 /DNA_ORIENTATION=+